MFTVRVNQSLLKSTGIFPGSLSALEMSTLSTDGYAPQQDAFGTCMYLHNSEVTEWLESLLSNLPENNTPPISHGLPYLEDMK